jgi:adenylate cyclase
MSEFTYLRVSDDVIVRELDLIRVKGKLEPVKIFEVVALTDTGNAKLKRYLESR